MCPGHERWHRNPGFYYLAGGGPMLDIGPYYITDLVNLLGPVASVSGVATSLRSERTITSKPLAGTRIPVQVATHVTGVLTFADGAAVSITMNSTCRATGTFPIELYGETGCLSFRYRRFRRQGRAGDGRRGLARDPHPARLRDGNYRVIGVADMARAIRSGRPHRASGALAFHVLEVMEAFQISSDSGKAVAIATRQRPSAPPASLALGELD